MKGSDVKRWAFATAWLWFAVAMNTLGGSLLALQLLQITPTHGVPDWLGAYALVASIAQIICLIALLRWMRWGMWGLLIIGLVTFVANLSHGTNVLLCLIGLAGPIITFAVLNGGRE